MKARCNHDWRRDWSDGRAGRIECVKCQTGVLVTLGDLAWRIAKAKGGTA